MTPAQLVAAELRAVIAQHERTIAAMRAGYAVLADDYAALRQHAIVTDHQLLHLTAGFAMREAQARRIRA